MNVEEGLPTDVMLIALMGTVFGFSSLGLAIRVCGRLWEPQAQAADRWLRANVPLVLKIGTLAFAPAFAWAVAGLLVRLSLDFWDELTLFRVFSWAALLGVFLGGAVWGRWFFDK